MDITRRPDGAWCIIKTSTLPTDRTTLWAQISTMRGVNEELRPWLRMSTPPRARDASLEDTPRGAVAFFSWLLFLGVVPFDRHALRLLEVVPASHFVEESWSWMQRVWRHERRIHDAPRGVQLTDTVTFIPRISVFGALTARVVDALFTHRHARLRARSYAR